MSEAVLKKRNLTVRSRLEKIYEIYGRLPTENELRAISELPLGRFGDLYDKSETGLRIWDLLLRSELNRDVSLLEEAGQLLWDQVTRRPYSMVPHTSPPKEEPIDRLGLVGEPNPTKLGTSGTTNREYLNDGDMNNDTKPKGSSDGGLVQKGAVPGLSNDRSAEEVTYREGEDDIPVPAAKRLKLNHITYQPRPGNGLLPWTSLAEQGHIPGNAPGGRAPTVCYRPVGHTSNFNFRNYNTAPPRHRRRSPVSNSQYHEDRSIRDVYQDRSTHGVTQPYTPSRLAPPLLTGAHAFYHIGRAPGVDHTTTDRAI